MIVTSEQWAKVDKKYSKLMWKISHYISGDTAISSTEDNYSDLQIAALEAIRGFAKKTERAFDDFFGEKLFDQYFKTCLWNMKNNKGSKISRTMCLRKGSVSIEAYGDALDISGMDSNSVELPVFLKDAKSELHPEQIGIIHLLFRDGAYTKGSGVPNITRLAGTLGMTWNETNRHLGKIKEVLKDYEA